MEAIATKTAQTTLPEIMTPLSENGRLQKVNDLLAEILPANPFWRAKLGDSRQCDSAEDFLSLPLLTKDELMSDSALNPPFGTNLTYPLRRYTRYHQTSGTTGKPMRILDTEESWNWWGRCWIEVFKSAGVTAHDRLFFAFSFAPSVGFWSSYRGGEMLGAMVIPSGGASTQQRLRMIFDTGATVLLCTPSYALRMAEVAEQENIPIRESKIRTLIHAGEPGASIYNTRKRLMEAWNAKVIDHAGATEIGAWGIGLSDGRGLWINEEEFIAEVLDPETLQPVGPGDHGELVLTNLGRMGCPVLRYRTGDIVCPLRELMSDGSTRLILEGGVLGRADDMITIRAVNIFPSGVENLIREIAGGLEFRVTATRRNEMDDLAVELEGDSEMSARVEAHLREQLGIRVDVKPVSAGSLPRWEAKAKRFIDLRFGG